MNGNDEPTRHSSRFLHFDEDLIHLENDPKPCCNTNNLEFDLDTYKQRNPIAMADINDCETETLQDGQDLATALMNDDSDNSDNGMYIYL